MMLRIPGVLDARQVEACRRLLLSAEWVDGRVTAGHQSARVKNNLQVPEADAQGRKVGETILDALNANNLFISAALPLRVFPPLFNRYGPGHAFGNHVDNAIRQSRGGLRIRTDLSATLFLTPPEDYEGGELVAEDTFGSHAVKLPAGDMILYPASSLHHVRPVTRGERMCSFFWIQSLVADDGERTELYQLDQAIQRLAHDHPEHASVDRLTAVYHNLVRRWAEV